jgi:hypothetical protein
VAKLAITKTGRLTASIASRICAIENLVPPRELRMVGVGEPLGDDALQVSIDHGAVKRPPPTPSQSRPRRLKFRERGVRVRIDQGNDGR